MRSPPLTLHATKFQTLAVYLAPVYRLKLGSMLDDGSRSDPSCIQLVCTRSRSVYNTVMIVSMLSGPTKRRHSRGKGHSQPHVVLLLATS